MSSVLSSRILKIEDLLKLGRFRPASVQRDFQWGPEEAGRLLGQLSEVALSGEARAEELEAPDAEDEAALAGPDTDQTEDDETGLPGELAEEPAAAPELMPAFFVGSLLLKPTGDGVFEIFDGLQRLTSLTIIVSVLRDLIGEPAMKARLAACVEFAPRSYRLVHSGREDTLARIVQKPGEASIRRQDRSRPTTSAGRRVFDVTRRVRQALDRRTSEERERLARYLLEGVNAAVIETSNVRLARHIFVASNLYGLPLRRDEVFKGELIALAAGEAEAGELLRKWDRLRERVGDGLEAFLTTYDMIERRQAQGPDCLGDLITHLETKSKAGKLMASVDTMLAHAEAWVELEEQLKSPHGGLIGNQIWRLSFFKWQDWRPLALHWLERRRAWSQGKRRSKDKTLQRFDMLVRRAMAITLYEFSDEVRAQMFLDALRDCVRSKPREPFGFHKEGKPALEFSKRVRADIGASLRLPIEDYEVRRSFVLWLEASLWDLAPGYLRGGSVEHILPTTPALDGEWRRNFPSEEERYLRLHSIGNLALVDEPVNRMLSNRPFADKLRILGEEQQVGRYKLLTDVVAAPAWTPKAITDRAESLAEFAWRELRLPPVAGLTPSN